MAHSHWFDVNWPIAELNEIIHKKAIKQKINNFVYSNILTRFRKRVPTFRFWFVHLIDCSLIIYVDINKNKVRTRENYENILYLRSVPTSVGCFILPKVLWYMIEPPDPNILTTNSSPSEKKIKIFHFSLWP